MLDKLYSNQSELGCCTSFNFHTDIILTNLLIFIIVLVTLLLFIRWRARLATQKLLGHPMPNLDTGLSQHPDGIVLFFHPPRCAPYKPIAKQIDQIAAITPERVLKINVEEEAGLTQAFGILTHHTIHQKQQR
ncbi:MAG: thioredoxin family protein [Gammaproteobacteria bacterium]|nr:thioredoxin family protein [Gammaproteobacteria bacterium]